PLPLPIIGNLHQIAFHKIGDIDIGTWSFFPLRKKYGETFEIYLGSVRAIITGDPKALDKVYNSSSKNNFTIRPTLNGLSELRTHNGLLLNNDEKSWSRNRKFISHTLL
ncbi:12966_t:CDS:1, partial [Acaulospora morrowiae]